MFCLLDMCLFQEYSEFLPVSEARVCTMAESADKDCGGDQTHGGFEDALWALILIISFLRRISRGDESAGRGSSVLSFVPEQ